MAPPCTWGRQNGLVCSLVAQGSLAWPHYLTTVIGFEHVRHREFEMWFYYKLLSMLLKHSMY